MTALQKQTVKVYLINFAGCTTRTGFYARLARTFGLSAAIAFNGKAWETLCQRVAMLARSGYSVRVHLHDLDSIYPTMKTECEISCASSAPQANPATISAPKPSSARQNGGYN